MAYYLQIRTVFNSVGALYIGAILLSLLLAGCMPAGIPITATAPAMPEVTSLEPSIEIASVLSEREIKEYMAALASNSTEEAEQALRLVVESGDTHFIAVLVELMRAKQIGIVSGPAYVEIIEGLEVLSGQAFGDSWPDWIEWYGGTELEPPPGFTAWKGSLLARIDPGFGRFLNESSSVDIRVEEIVWGGVAVDGIPALDQPAMITAESADYLLPGEPVFGIELNGEARAYPLRIMDWHEMANDVIGGVPVSLAYCTLCGAGIAYDGRTEDAGILTFGSSGLLYRSNKLMYDRQTDTLWNQLTGKPVTGELVGSDVSLDLIPVVISSWQDWKDQHPSTQVLSLETGYARRYTPGAAYGDYFSSTNTMFPVWQRDNRFATKERIFALRLEGVPKAYSLETLSEERVVNDRLADLNLVVVMNGDQVTVEGSSLRTGDVSYQAGGQVRAYQRGNHEFRAAENSDVLIDQAGTRWRVTEGALVSPDNRRLTRLPGHLAYWFGWYSFFPQTEVYPAR